MAAEGNYFARHMEEIGKERARRAAEQRGSPAHKAQAAREWMGIAAAPIHADDETEITDHHISVGKPSIDIMPETYTRPHIAVKTVRTPREAPPSTTASVPIAETRVADGHVVAATEEKAVSNLSTEEQSQRVWEMARQRVEKELAQGVTAEDLRTLLEARLAAAQEEAEDIQDQPQLLAQNERQQHQIQTELAILQEKTL